MPADLTRLAGDVERYRHPDRSRLATGTLDRTVRDVVRQRLLHHHGVTTGEDVLANARPESFSARRRRRC